MRIVMLCDLYDDSQLYRENLLAKYYSKHGHQVTVVASTFTSVLDYVADRYNKSDPGRKYNDGQVKVIKLPYSLNLMNKLRKFDGVRIGEILNEEEPGVIYLHDIHLNIREAVNYIKKNPQTRIIMGYHADYSNSARNWISLNILHKLIRKSILQKGIRYIQKIYPITPASIVFLRDVYGVPLSKIELLPLGSDTDTAKKVIQAKEGLLIRKTISIPEDHIVIFTGGKLMPVKKTHILINAFNTISNPNLHLMIVGDTDKKDNNYKSQLLNLCNENERIHFVGWVEGKEIYKYMNACDLAVFPSSQSVLWQQAISMGLPLIVGQTGVQDPSYLNLHGNIIILEEKNVKADVIAKRICELAETPDLLNSLRNAALETSDELLNYDKIISKTLEIASTQDSAIENS